MLGRSIRGLFLLVVLPISLTSCSDQLPVAPTNNDAAQLQSRLVRSASSLAARPIKGDCSTAFTFIDPGAAGQCAVFQPVPSAFIAISGQCAVSHLGRTELNAVQQLVFLLDASGQPVVIQGQPVVTQLRNCSTLTAANGDALVHTTIGEVAPAGPAQVEFSGPMAFVGGTGRFARASGQATFSGTASLATNTGGFSFEGTVSY
jgi:hypothetical protein